MTFDQDMREGDPAAAGSVLNPANDRLTGDAVGAVEVLAVTYDPGTRTATLSVAPLTGDHYKFRALTGVESARGVRLAVEYAGDSTATADLTGVLGVRFTLARSDRATGAVSFDATVTNTGPRAVLLPVVLSLSPRNHFPGEPSGSEGRGPDGAWRIDLSASLPAGGLLAPGQSTAGRAIAVRTVNGRPVAFSPSVSGVPGANRAPAFASDPVTVAAAGQGYAYDAVGFDPDGDGLSYVLARGPAGMTVDAATGRVTWAPTATSPARAVVVLRVYDAAGASGTQAFAVLVSGANQAPVFDALPDEVVGREGEPISIPVRASDAEGDRLVDWVGNLPPGATFDAARQSIDWTPAAGAAGTDPSVTMWVTDGVTPVSASVTVTVRPNPRPPVFDRPAGVTVREGDPVRVQLHATQSRGAALHFTSDELPAGATLDPVTGRLDWTPGFTQRGAYRFPVTVSDGRASTTQTVAVVVLNANGRPEFGAVGAFQIRQGELRQVRALATDPDNPDFTPPDRLPDGTLVKPGPGRASVTYAAAGLPAGAVFDAESQTLRWAPAYDQAGVFRVTFTATDDGDGLGTPLTAAAEVVVTVLPVNRAPRGVPIANASVARGATLMVPVAVTDPDGDRLTLTAAALPRFATFTDNGDGTGVLRFAPGAADRGNSVVRVTATDSGKGGPRRPSRRPSSSSCRCRCRTTRPPSSSLGTRWR